MPDTRHLEQRRRTWYVVADVPPSLRQTLGRKRLRKTTGTADLRVAQGRRWSILVEFKGRIEAARRRLGTDPLAAEALGWQVELASPHNQADPDHREAIEGRLTDRAADIEREKGYGVAKAFYDFATGQATPLSLHVDTWLAETPCQPSTAGDHRRAVRRLVTWLGAEGLPPTVEGVTRKIAGRYVSEALLKPGPGWSGDRKTVAKYLSSLSSYWGWLARKGHAPEGGGNPWKGQAPPEAPAHQTGEEKGKREFTAGEMVKLFTGPAPDYLPDLMRLGALSGMRIEELCGLRVRDVRDGDMHVTRAKTKAGRRAVPVHPDAAVTVARRCEGKPPDAFLFQELDSARRGSARERSMKAVKAFGRYRKAVGVDDPVAGKRQGRVTFHSFRRWFITAAERAGQPPHIISAVVGHERTGMTLSVYSGGPSDRQCRACVEAVRLPSGCVAEPLGSP